jgi:TRAP-type mannitol/chloroaromatic compound transport system permease small subunit
VVGYYSIDFVTMSWSVKEISTEPGGLSFVFIQKSFIFLLPLVLMLAGTKELFKAWK